MFAVPVLTAVVTPTWPTTLDTVATVGLLDVKLALAVRSTIEPSL